MELVDWIFQPPFMRFGHVQRLCHSSSEPVYFNIAESVGQPMSWKQYINERMA